MPGPASARWRRPCGLAGVVACLLLLSGPVGPAAAQSDRLKAVERALQQDRDKAQHLANEGEQIDTQILTLQVEMLSAARRTQDLEEELSAIERSLADLEAEAAARTADLAANRGRQGRTLAALQRIALQPPQALIAAPGTPVDTVRSALLLGVAVSAIERRADGLRSDLEDVRRIAREVHSRRSDLAAAIESLENQRHGLRQLVNRKRTLQAGVQAEQDALDAHSESLAAEAADLRDLIARLQREAQIRAEREAERLKTEQAAARRAEELAAKQATKLAAKQEARLSPPAAPAEPAKPSNLRPFPAAPSAASLIMPARGRLVWRYGQKAEDDAVSKGLTIATRAAAQVVAPFDGRVAYAGEFRGYGRILIIEHGKQYHTLLAGLEQLDAVIGQWVLGGEPVGLMGRPPGRDPELYLELRRTGEPINPQPWLATSNDKVRG